MQDTAIHAEGLSKIYKGGWGRPPVHALDELDLTVQKGEIFGLLGPNGAGKTTLVKTLLGIVHATSGSATLFNLPITKAYSRTRIGYLPEDHNFPGYLTGETCLDFYGAMSGMPGDVRKAKIEPALDAVGLLKWKTMKVRKYSKGMKQRLGIATAIFHAPELVFLDEPTDGVDPQGRHAIREIILDLNRQGTTVFINSHLLQEVELICHQVVILKEGKVVKEGTIEDLTQAEGEFIFGTRGSAAEVEERLKERCLNLTLFAEGFKATVKEEKDVDHLVDILRSAGLGIRAITPVKVSLEDLFVKIVEEEGGSAP